MSEIFEIPGESGKWRIACGDVPGSSYRIIEKVNEMPILLLGDGIRGESFSSSTCVVVSDSIGYAVPVSNYDGQYRIMGFNEIKMIFRDGRKIWEKVNF